MAYHSISWPHSVWQIFGGQKPWNLCKMLPKMMNILEKQTELISWNFMIICEWSWNIFKCQFTRGCNGWVDSFWNPVLSHPPPQLILVLLQKYNRKYIQLAAYCESCRSIAKWNIHIQGTYNVYRAEFANDIIGSLDIPQIKKEACGLSRLDRRAALAIDRRSNGLALIFLQ